MSISQGKTYHPLISLPIENLLLATDFVWAQWEALETGESAEKDVTDTQHKSEHKH